jgi:hypothetical protein
MSRRFELDPGITPEQQIEKLAEFVNNLAGDLPKLQIEIGQVHGRVDDAVADMAKRVADAQAHADSVGAELYALLDRGQMRDLGWAIGGVAITTIGMAFSYF